MSKIVVIGSSNTDMIIQAERIPKPGETILGGAFTTAAGGKGANQAVAAARAGGDVSFIARIGNDILGEQSLQGFKNDGIEISNIYKDETEPSGVALIMVSAEGENSIAVASGANAKLMPNHVRDARQAVENADILLMQLETPIDTVLEGAKIAHSSGVKTILNPAPAQKLPDELFRFLDILTPNESEAELLTGIPVKDTVSAQKAARALIKKGVGTIIITMGAEGVWLESKNIQIRIPGFSVAAVDTTAAGDVFNGAFAVALAENLPIEQAVRFANAAAAISVTKMGAQPSIPLRKEIERFLNNHLA